jgi:hypothetical protein
MTEPSRDAATSAFERTLAHRPELLEGFLAFEASFQHDGLVPPRLLELCRLRIACMHGAASQWRKRDETVVLTPGELAALRDGRLDAFRDAERAALDVAECMPFQHRAIDDATVAAVVRHLGEPGCVSLMTAVAVFDARCRLEAVLSN